MSSNVGPIAPSRQPSHRPDLGATQPIPDLPADPLDELLHRTANDLWWADVIRRGMVAWLLAAAAIAAWVLFDHHVGWGGLTTRWFVLILFVAGGIGLMWSLIRPMFRRIDLVYAARVIERDQPQLRGGLSSYVELRNQSGADGLSSRMIRASGRVAAKSVDPDRTPAEATGTLPYWIAGIAALMAMLLYGVLSSKSTAASVARVLLPAADIAVPSRVRITDIEPGNTDANPGRPIQIIATIKGLADDETARWELWATGSTEQAIASADLSFQPSTVDRYASPLNVPANASSIMRYRIVAGDAMSRWFELRVADLPVVEITEVRVTPPTYTGLEPYQTRSPSISAVDGSDIEVVARVNRRVVDAKLQFNPTPSSSRQNSPAGQVDFAMVDAAGQSTSVDDDNVMRANFTLRSQGRRATSAAPTSYRIVVRGEDQSVNADPIVWPIEIIEDLPPEVTITTPTSDPARVPVDAVQVIRVQAFDPDHGLSEVRLDLESGVTRYDTVMMYPPKTAPSESSHRGNLVVEYRLRPAKMGLRVGDEVTATVTAVDNRPFKDADESAGRTTADPIRIVIEPASGQSSEEEDEGPQESPDDSGMQDSSAQESGQPSRDENAGQPPGGSSQGGDSQGEGGSSQSGDRSQGEGGQADGSADQQSGSQQGDRASGGELSESSESSSDSDASPSDSPPSDSPPSDSPPSESSRGGDAGGADNQASGSGEPRNADGEPMPPGGDNDNQNGSQDTASSGKASPNQSTSETEPSGEPNRGPSNTDRPNGVKQDNRDSNDGESDDRSPQGPPSHDGEAFERIADYMKSNPNQPPSGGGSSSEAAKAPDKTGPRDQSSKSGSDDGSDDRDDASGNASKQSQGMSEPKTSDTEGADSNDGESDQSEGGEGDDSKRGDGDQDRGEQGNRETGGDKSAETRAGEANSSDDDNAAGSSDSESSGSPDATTPLDSDSDSDSGQPSMPNRDQNSDAASESSDSSSPADSSASSGEPGDAPEPGDGRPLDNGAETPPAGQRDPSTPSSDVDRDQTREAAENGDGRPGSNDAGSQDPGSQDPGSQDPGSQDPGSNDSGSNSESKSSGGRPANGVGGEANDNATGDEAGEMATDQSDPVDLDYADQATDMVLDYLDQQSKQPDSELLDELQWSEEQLDAFRQRWRQAKQMNQDPNASDNDDLAEALQSLGLRRPGTDRSIQRDRSDELQGLRDGGPRRRPPPAHRDAFDRFRRSLTP